VSACDRCGAQGLLRARAWLALAALALLALSACRTAPRSARVQPDSDALRELAQAEIALDRAHAADPAQRAALLEQARLHAAAAAQHAPRWIAPARLEQERARLEGRLHLAYASALEAWHAQPESAAANYLLARLHVGLEADEATNDWLGELGRRGLAADPSEPFAWHARALRERGANRRAAATSAHERALSLARGPHERALFALGLARLWQREQDFERLRALCVQELPLLARDSRHARELELSWLQAALARRDAPDRSPELARAHELLADERLQADEARLLTQLLCATPQSLEPAQRLRGIERALARRSDALGLELSARARLQLANGPLAYERARRAFGPELSGAALMETERRALRCAGGEAAAVVLEALGGLPQRARNAQGELWLQALARLESAARALQDARVDEARSAARVQLGAALVDAGWYTEAAAWAEALAASEYEAAEALERRASAGRALLRSFELLLERGPSLPLPPELISAERTVDFGELIAHSRRLGLRKLDYLLEGLEALCAAHWPELYPGESRPSTALTESPLLHYGPFARIVHPGPLHSRADERAGIGRAGEAVPGFAAHAARMGYFGVLGAAVHRERPDGALLRLVHVEERSGEVLGVPWSGTVAWCEGAAIQSRAARAGAHIAGAALHEGYWIDLEPLRATARWWSELERAHPGARARVALAGQSARRALLAGGAARVRVPWLGEAQRVALALIEERRERGAPESIEASRERSAPVSIEAHRERGAPVVGLEDVLEHTERHEQAHVCERTRFLPLSAHWWSALRFAARSGFSPAALEARLEYRAELGALCTLSEPRVALVEVLRLAEHGERSSPHARAYDELARELVAELARELDRDPASHPGIDATRVLEHQLHRLSPQGLRALALELARREGLLAE
jgi:hypothetical protein